MSKGQTLQDPYLNTQKGACSGIHLPRKRNQTSGPNRVIRPVRRTAQKYRIADGLQARHLNSCSRPQRSYPDRCERGRGCLTLIASASQ